MRKLLIVAFILCYGLMATSKPASFVNHLEVLPGSCDSPVGCCIETSVIGEVN